MRTRLMRGKFTLFFMMFGILLAVPAIAFAQDVTGSTTLLPGPTIQSDKADYAPGELVTLTGGNWQAGESVNIVVNDDAGQTWNRNVNVTADASGNITDSFNLPDWFVATYSVTATGAQSGVATSTFTDGQLKAAASNLSGTQQWTVTSQKYSSNNCAAGTEVGGVATTTTLSGTTQSGNLSGGTNTNSVKLEASNPSATGGKAFDKWTWTNTNNPAGTVTGSDTNASTCVDSGKLAANDLAYTANYATTVSTTTTASPASATYGDSSVTLNANVAPASGSAVNTGTVTFTVKNGAGTTVGSPVTSGTVSGGSASASFSLGSVNAGSYTIQAVYNAGSGFNTSNNTAQSPAPTLTVNKASSITTVTCTAGPFTYDGSAKTPCSANVTGAGGLNQAVTPVSYTNNTGAGTATASATFAGDANHNGSTGTKDFTIGKANTTTTVSCTAGPFTYTGSAITPCTVSVTGAGGLNLSPAADYANNTNAGTATASYTYAGDANHNGSNDSKTFTIDKAAATINVNGYTGTYDGQAHGATGSAKGVDGAELPSSLLHLGASYTNVPGGQADWTFDGNGNYKAASGSVAIVINKASSTTTVNCPASVTYTGSALTPCTATVTGAGGLNQSLTVSYQNNTGAGTATASASFAGDANHNNSSNSKTFAILYDFRTYLQPINDTAHQTGILESKFKLGQTIPVKFNIYNAAGSVVQQATNPTFTKVSHGACDAQTALEDPTTETPNPGAQFVWTTDHYQYNWSTKGLSAGEYRIYANLADGTGQQNTDLLHQNYTDICLTK